MERHQNYSMKNEKHDFYVDVHTTYICTYVYVIRRLPFFLFFLFFFFCTWGNPHGHPLSRSFGKRRGSVGLYRLKPHGGPPDAQLGCPGISFELLPEHSCVFSCLR